MISPLKEESKEAAVFSCLIVFFLFIRYIVLIIFIIFQYIFLFEASFFS